MKPVLTCRDCGAPKGEKPYERRRWYCEACEEKRFHARNPHDCGADTGHPWMCKACKVIRQEKAREAAQRGVETRRKNYPNWRRPESANMFWAGVAHGMVSRAKRLGILPELDGTIACVDCGAVAIEYDHRDYGRPLDVQPVCRCCNKARGTAVWPSAQRFQFARVAAPSSKKKAA